MKRNRVICHVIYCIAAFLLAQNVFSQQQGKKEFLHPGMSTTVTYSVAQFIVYFAFVRVTMQPEKPAKVGEFDI